MKIVHNSIEHNGVDQWRLENMYPLRLDREKLDDNFLKVGDVVDQDASIFAHPGTLSLRRSCSMTNGSSRG